MNPPKMVSGVGIGHGSHPRPCRLLPSFASSASAPTSMSKMHISAENFRAHWHPVCYPARLWEYPTTVSLPYTSLKPPLLHAACSGVGQGNCRRRRHPSRRPLCCRCYSLIQRGLVAILLSRAPPPARSLESLHTRPPFPRAPTSCHWRFCSQGHPLQFGSLDAQGEGHP